MKRIIEFQVFDDKFLFKENNIDIFKIDKSTMQLDVKYFYEAFFANRTDFSEIEIINSSELDRDDERVYSAISKLINDIYSKLKIKLSEKIDIQDDIQPYKMSNDTPTEQQAVVTEEKIADT